MYIIGSEREIVGLLLFCAAFITQLVGHRMGDYLFQTDWQAQNKAENPAARVRHVFVYSMTIAVLMLLMFNWHWGLAFTVFVLTFMEHYIVDSRKPIIWWKTFLEKSIARQKGFDIKELPFFVLIEIDQTVHYIRIFIISIMIGSGFIPF